MTHFMTRALSLAPPQALPRLVDVDAPEASEGRGACQGPPHLMWCGTAILMCLVEHFGEALIDHFGETTWVASS